MRLALVFPGQGVDGPELGGPWATHPLVQEVSTHLDVDVGRLLRRGGPALFRTEVLQPTLVALGLVAVEALRGASVRWTICAGHSLGEWTAWGAAGGIGASTLLELVVQRARLMAAAARATPGGMVQGDPFDGLDLAIEALDGCVYSGPTGAVKAAVAAGGKRLRVDGPWHSQWMEPARVALAPRVPASRALEAQLILAERGRPEVAESVPNALLGQLVGTARWSSVVSALATRADALVAIGPSRVLAHDLRTTGLPVYRLDGPRDVDEIADLHALGGDR